MIIVAVAVGRRLVMVSSMQANDCERSLETASGAVMSLGEGRLWSETSAKLKKSTPAPTRATTSRPPDGLLCPAQFLPTGEAASRRTTASPTNSATTLPSFSFLTITVNHPKAHSFLHQIHEKANKNINYHEIFVNFVTHKAITKHKCINHHE